MHVKNAQILPPVHVTIARRKDVENVLIQFVVIVVFPCVKNVKMIVTLIADVLEIAMNAEMM